MGIDGIIDGNGFEIALTGMSVVFAGLVLVSGYITLLPRVLTWAENRRQPGRSGVAVAGRPATASPAGNRGDADLFAAIGYVLQAERDRELLSDHQVITQREHDDEQRTWTAIGKMRSLSTRM